MNKTEKNIEYLKKYYKGNLEDAIKRLENNEPVQYIVGNVDFYGYIFEVDKNVLIPRRETEELVEKTIEKLSVFNNPIIGDIGTGSGCIAVTLSKELNRKVFASDISVDALNVAKRNITSNNAAVMLLQGDTLKPYIDNDIKLDVIISNPPYISYDEEIEEIVKNNEPNIALFAPNNGLECYEKIIMDSKKVLNDKFLIAFEIGYQQADEIVKIVNTYLDDVTVEIEKDLSGKNRFVFVYN